MSNFAVTPHINVQNEIGFGKTVLMPGDPLRAKFIAENFLENPVLVNNVRGVNGYTGYYKGVKVSVMASGMGMPAIGIYSHELFNFFGVENISVLDPPAPSRITSICTTSFWVRAPAPTAISLPSSICPATSLPSQTSSC